MTPSVDPEKVAQREELAKKMAEFEASNGPIETLPIIERNNDEPVCSVVSDMQRRRGRKGHRSRGRRK